MIPILYKKDDDNYTRNGAGFLIDALSMQVTEERNGIYEAQMTYPIDGKLFGSIEKGDIIKAKSNDTSEFQLFRIYLISKPLNGIVTVKAEHISYDANGIPLAAVSGTSITAQTAIGRAINAAAFQEGFLAWSDIATLNSFKITEPCSLRSALGGVEGSILDVWGGEYEFDNKTIKLHAHRGSDHGVVIEYGKNLTDAVQESHIANTYTHLMPFAKYMLENENTGESTEIVVTLTEKVLPLTNCENIGHHKAYIADLSDLFGENEQITEDTLRAKATLYIANHPELGKPRISITASFVALWQTEQYKDIAPLERVSLCDTVTIRFVKLGIDAKAKVIKTVYDTLNESYISITLGEAKSNFANTVLAQNEAISALRNIVTKGFSDASAAVQKAILDATNAITGNSGGYVVTYPAEHPQEILILDNPDISLAVNVWRWNSAGLGHSSTGYNGTYTTAITADGKIVADFVSAGTLNGGLLQAGSVSSNAISQAFKTEISDSISGTATTLRQEFTAADGQLSSRITAIDTTIGTMQTEISQQAQQISLKVSAGDVVSVINQSADTITLSAGRLVITAGNFQLDASGNASLINATISGTFRATNVSENYYTEIKEGAISLYVNNVKAGVIKAEDLGGTQASLAILGSKDSLGITIGCEDPIHGLTQTFYYCDPSSSGTFFRHCFYGDVKFINHVWCEDDINANTLVTAGIGMTAPSYSNTAGGNMLHGDTSGNTYVGNTSKETQISGSTITIGDTSHRTHVFGSYIFIRNDIHFEGDIYFYNRSTNYQYKSFWYDSYNRAINVGNDSLALYLKGTTIYANNSPIATSSDERIKKDIEVLDNRYLRLMQVLVPRRFRYSNGSKGRMHTGFTAQDLLSVMNGVGISRQELAAFVDVSEGKDEEYAIRYEELISPLLQYVQHLEDRIKALEGVR